MNKNNFISAFTVILRLIAQSEASSRIHGLEIMNE
jgi:hypothetical protein